MRIACVGDNCIDFYDETGEACPGGNPVNVAVGVRRLGGEPSYVGAVGTDAYGELLLRALKERGVDVGHVRVCRGSTPVSHVTMRDGDRVFGEYDEGVMRDFSPSDGEIDFLCGHDIVFTALWGRSEKALRAARERGVPTAFDAADKPRSAAAQAALPYSTVFFFSDDESGDGALRDTLRELKEKGPSVAVAMRGGRGSAAFDGESFYECAAAPCEVVDTMGAGDSYIAGFLTSWLGGRSVPACMEAGSRSAALTIGRRGAW